MANRPSRLDLSDVRVLGILVALISVGFILLGSYVQHCVREKGATAGQSTVCVFDPVGLLVDLWSNVAVDLLSIAVAVLIIERLGERRDKRQEKERLIRRMGSTYNSTALQAVEELRVLGWLEDGSLQEANLDGAQLQGADLRGANLRGAYLYGANLRGAILERTDLREADLCETNLQGANLRAADLSGAKLSRADLQKARLHDANLRKATLRRADLREALLAEANLQEADLGRANLQEADFFSTSLRGANLSNANLKGTGLTDSQLAEAALLRGATRPDGERHDNEYPALPPGA